MALRDTIQQVSELLFRSLDGAGGEGEDPSFEIVNRVINDTADERDEIQKLRDFFDGNQIEGTGLRKGELYIPSWPGEDDDDHETRADRMKDLSWNRIRDGVLTHADALYAWGKGRAVSRKINWEDAEDVDDEDQEWWNEYYRKRFLKLNSFPTTAWEIWSYVGAERRSLAMLRWLDSSGRRLKRFTSLDNEDHKEDGVVWIEILDNLNYIALPHPDQTSTLGAVIRWYLDPEAGTVHTASSSMTAHPGNKHTITELITDNLWLRWRGRELVKHSWGTENRYGDVRTMFVWARNPRDIADSEDALESQTILNEHLYSGQEIKRQHAFPETLYKGYEPPMKDDGKGNKTLLRGPNVAHVAEDPSADITKTSPDMGVSEVGQAEQSIHQMMDDALGISQFDRGETSGMGQMRSAPAIARMQARSERRRRRKIMFAHRWEQEMFRSMMEMTIYHAWGKDKETRKRFRSVDLDVEWPEDAFMMDPATEAMKDAQEVQAGLADRETQVRKRHPDASEEEIQEILDRIESQMEDPQDVSAEPTPIERSAAQK